MSAFVRKDPRGLLFVMDEDVWLHAAAHHGAFNGSYLLVMKTIAEPDKIIDNPQFKGRQARTAQERYIRYIADLKQYLVIPARISTNEEKVDGYGNVPAGSRFAVTIHTDPEPENPAVKVWWRKV